MRQRRRYQPIARVRRFLLLVLFLFGGGLTGFYLSGRLERAGDGRAPRERSSGAGGVGGDILTVAEGFDYEVTDGSELAFRIRADRLVSDVEDRITLEGVTLELPQDDDQLVVEGESATIHLASQSASISGNVSARDGEGLELRSAGFEIVREGKGLVSTAPVSFGLRNEYRGRADSLSYQIKKKRLNLEGRIVVQGLPVGDPQAASLRADKLVLERQEGLLRIEGEVRLARGAEFLETARLSITFGADEKTVRFVRAERDVVGRYLPLPTGEELARRIDFNGRVLYAVFEEGSDQARQAELLGGNRNDAEMTILDESGLARTLRARVLRADFEHGEVRYAEAHEPVTFEERLAHAPAALLRRLCADRMDVELDAQGELSDLTLDGSVDYQTPGLQALGDRIVAHGSDEQEIVFTGEPATVVDSRGMVQAPLIRRFADGVVEAREGVRAELARGSGHSLAGGDDADEPVRITAETATWTTDPEELIFEGDVRAWQGEDYLVAKRLIGEAERDLLTAEGKVKTVSRRSVAGPGSADGEADDGPIEVTADKLVYERARRLITYDGDARVLQAGRKMSCNRLDVELDEADEFERMICTGALRVEDPAQGKKVAGDRAVYLPASDSVEVTGEPVVLSDRGGTEIRGGKVIYRFSNGVAEILSREARPEAETAEESPEEDDEDGVEEEG